MSLFNHKISLQEIIREIPDSELMRIARESRVDHYSKVLSGKLTFYLFLYGMLRINRLSRRGLVDAFSSPVFRLMFNPSGKKTISHSSLSERLSVIETDFFRKAYECIYRRFSSLYTKKEIAQFHLQRVDSTLVAEAGNRLSAGMTCGNDHVKKKMIKYTINFDGMFASLGNVYSDESYASESLAMPENILSHFKKEKDHAPVYLFDRGLSSSEKSGHLQAEDGLLFVGRLIENRKLKIVKDLLSEEDVFTQGKLLQDSLAQIYGYEQSVSRTGKPVSRQHLCPEIYRVIRFQPAEGLPVLLITNVPDVPADTIAPMYKRRWDIEVFFVSSNRS